MNTHRHRSSLRLDSQISALLDRVSESQSVVDRLMAMPLPDNDQPSTSLQWDRAVARRLEVQIVEIMKNALGDEAERKSA